jgi:NTE family protein
MLAGLARRGVDLSGADTVVGTSAGAMVAAWVATGRDLQALYEQHLQPDLPTEAVLVAPALLARVPWLLLRYWTDPRAFRTQSGALASRVPPDVAAEQLSGIWQLLETRDWPRRNLLLATVDADTGEPVALGKAAAVDLVTAVAASTTLPGARPPIAAAGRRLIDGGFRSATNADLAAGRDPVVVLSPTLAGIGPIPSARRQIAVLRRDATVLTLTPDPASRRAMGANPLKDANRPRAGRAGYRQGMAAAAAVARALRGGA